MNYQRPTALAYFSWLQVMTYITSIRGSWALQEPQLVLPANLNSERL
jgi:hypothetical protein